MPNTDKNGRGTAESGNLGPIARLLSSTVGPLRRSSSSDGQTVNEEAAPTCHLATHRTRWRKAHSVAHHQRRFLGFPQRVWPASNSSSSQQHTRDFRLNSHPVHNVVQSNVTRGQNIKYQSSSAASRTSARETTTTTEQSDLLLGSVTRNQTRASTKASESRQRKSAVYSRVQSSASVGNIIQMYTTMLAERQSEFSEQNLKAKCEDEGCPGVAVPMCCSSEEDLAGESSTKRVARSTSADSAVDLEEPEAKSPAGEPELGNRPKRRMTLTVTDLPLRPALLPLPEPLALDCCDRAYNDDLEGCATCLVPSKTLLEAQLIELPIVPLDKDGPMASSASRRESSQSCFSEGPEMNVRILRTPSVVVSDYSDDVVCGGITLEEIEYFRGHRLGRRFSSDGRGVDYEDNDMSAASSCSNLNYCGSHISILDGLERESYETGLKTPERKMSASSTCSTLSGGEDDEQDLPISPTITKKKPSGWRKLRNIVQWTPFFQTYKKQRYPWVQLAGHQGNFKAGPDQGTVLKKLCPKEELCFRELMHDVMRPYVPEYRGQFTSEDGEYYLQLQDLLSDFSQPCVMDCKVGVRTYLEEELSKAKEKPKLRKDMYDKMIQIDPFAPTEEEHRAKGVTKPRYMVWRETISSTATLGFRIEGIKKADGTSSKDFKTTKSRDQIRSSFKDFTDQFPHVIPKYIQRLKAIRATLFSSDFFASHEVIGSSLLFVHDRVNASIWLIDFAKTIELPEHVVIDHNSAWAVGNHEDGYLIGINNLIDIFTELHQSQTKVSFEELSTAIKSQMTIEGTREELESPSSSHRSSINTTPTTTTTPTIVKTNSAQEIVILEKSQMSERGDT